MNQDFESDPAFMAWITEYFKNDGGWESEYSGNIRAMYDAFRAARPQPHPVDPQATWFATQPKGQPDDLIVRRHAKGCMTHATLDGIVSADQAEILMKRLDTIPAKQ